MPRPTAIAVPAAAAVASLRKLQRQEEIADQGDKPYEHVATVMTRMSCCRCATFRARGRPPVRSAPTSHQAAGDDNVRVFRVAPVAKALARNLEDPRLRHRSPEPC